MKQLLYLVIFKYKINHSFYLLDLSKFLREKIELKLYNIKSLKMSNYQKIVSERTKTQ